MIRFIYDTEKHFPTDFEEFDFSFFFFLFKNVRKQSLVNSMVLRLSRAYKLTMN